MIVAKLNKKEFSCKMCKEYSMKANVYVYKSFEISDYPSVESEICRKCAIREHGSKNKYKLDDIIEERTKKWQNQNHQE